MSAAAIVGIVYGSGLILAMVYGGAKGFTFWTGADPGPLMAMLLWPLALPYYLGQELAEMSERRSKRRRLAEEEKRKWLEAKIP